MECIVLKLLFFLVVMVYGQTLEGPSHKKVVVCYVATWAAYRPKPGAYDLDDLNPGLCTHLVYSFAGLDEVNSSIKPLDPWQDLEKDYGKNGYKRIVALKELYPHLKVTIAIGGWNEGSLKYSMLAEDAEKRSKFVKSVVHLLSTYKFDGLDLDWEYPARRDGRPQDKANYVTLVKELKEAFEPYNYIITAALGAGRDTMEAAYDLTKLSRYLDFLHLMCYDYHGTWDGVVGANAPLRGETDDDVLSIEYTIKYMLAHGVSPYKMVLGLPLYGRNFILKDASTKDVVFGKTAVESQGFKGPFTREAGFMGYNEICMELTNTSSSWSEHWDELSATPYLRDGNRLITYDNERSIALKVKMAMDYGLGGLMVWSIDTDDFQGVCGSSEEPHVDFLRRFQELKQEPVMRLVLEKQGVEGQTRHGFSKREIYYLENDEVTIRLPERLSSNYPLMRTINEATILSLAENRIMKEIEEMEKENEIGGKENGGVVNGLGWFGVGFCLVCRLL